MISDAILIAILTSLPSTIAAIATLIISIKSIRKVEEVHKATNSLTDRLVDVTRIEAHAAGVKEEKERNL